MDIQMNQMTAAPGTPATDSEFDLDVSIVESGPVIDELMRLTDDNCGSTCETACPDTGC
ncbi:MAG: FxLD family lanthipeptide [Pseudonocardiaceae bacterium]